MSRFVKDERFKMGDRLFLIISGQDYDPAFNTWTPPNQSGNVVRFIEIEKDRTYTDVFGRIRPTEIPPKVIANPKNEDEKLYNLHTKSEGVLVRDKAFMYSLISEGKMELL